MKKRVLMGLFSALFMVLSPCRAIDYFTEDFSYGFDMDGLSLTFTPDGSPDFYSAKVTAISALPINAASHIPVVLGDDDSEWVPLNGKTVKLYGGSYSGVGIGSNGYLTFAANDTTFFSNITNHFDRVRVSMFFRDLDPRYGGSVKWSQLDDRFVATYTDIPPWGSSTPTTFNTFQAEMFFDGVVRISWLGIGSSGAVVGLSRGHGVPSDFVETDLSVFGWDLDDDTIPNTWEIQYFGGSMSCNAGIDSDGDGFSNLEEYIAGMNPTNSLSFFHIVSQPQQQDPDGTSYVITWEAVEGREYSIWGRGNLVINNFDLLESGIDYPVNSYTTAIDQAQATRFYKVDVKLAE